MNTTCFWGEEPLRTRVVVILHRVCHTKKIFFVARKCIGNWTLRKNFKHFQISGVLVSGRDFLTLKFSECQTLRKFSNIFWLWKFSDFIFDFHLQWSFNQWSVTQWSFNDYSMITQRSFNDHFQFSIFNFSTHRNLSYIFWLWKFSDFSLDFLLQWSFNLWFIWYYCCCCCCFCCCWLGDPYGHLRILLIFDSRFSIFDANRPSRASPECRVPVDHPRSIAHRPAPTKADTENPTKSEAGSCSCQNSRAACTYWRPGGHPFRNRSSTTVRPTPLWQRAHHRSTHPTSSTESLFVRVQ